MSTQPFVALVAIAALSLGGCSAIAAKGSPYDVQHRAPGQFADIPDEDICVNYGDSPNAALRGELARRGLVRPDRWPLIDRGVVAVGMTVCEIMAVYGFNIFPHETVTALGSHIQWVAYGGAQYIYTDNGIVTAIQN